MRGGWNGDKVCHKGTRRSGKLFTKAAESAGGGEGGGETDTTGIKEIKKKNYPCNGRGTEKRAENYFNLREILEKKNIFRSFDLK